MNTERGPWTAEKLHELLGQFEAELREAGLAETSIRTYVDRSMEMSFVRCARRRLPARAAWMSPLPELDLERIRRFVDQRNERISPNARDQIRIELDVDAGSATILECRPPWRPEYGPEWTRFRIARLRYTKTRKEWALYWRDRTSSSIYDLAEPTANVETLLDEVDRDRTSIFWG